MADTSTLEGASAVQNKKAVSRKMVDFEILVSFDAEFQAASDTKPLGRGSSYFLNYFKFSFSRKTYVHALPNIAKKESRKYTSARKDAVCPGNGERYKARKP